MTTPKESGMTVDVDVVIVGFGPGGEVAASLIGQAGHRVLAIDKALAPYGQPRMSTLDGEIARVLQHAANPVEAMQDAIKAPNILLFGADGEPVPPIDWDYTIGGHPSHYSLHQPNIEAAMERRIAGCPSVEVRWGSRATAIEQCDGGVRVTIEIAAQDGVPPRTEIVSARYLLGFDGASSFVREAVGIELDVIHQHDERWIMTDFDALRPLPEIVTRSHFRMDPVRPFYAGPNGANRCRTDVRLLPEEDLDELLSEEHGYAFIEERFGLTPADVRLTRRIAYRFRSQLARSFRVGRVFIGGDAAHAMTPYMGQGACCAMRDAANLAWKLRLVLRGAADESLMDTYEPERLPHSAFFVHGSLATFQYVNELDPQKAAERDAATRAGLIKFPPIEGLVAGVLHRDSAGALASHAGQLAPQGLVRRGQGEGRLDDLTGYGGQLISSLPVAEVLGRERLNRLGELGVHVLRVADDDSAELVDLDGTYRNFWATTGATTLLARPDHYLFGVAADEDDVRALIDDFLAQIPRPAAEAPKAAATGRTHPSVAAVDLN
ncbi:bifunctional 3-(3-hydroxy-phenyl)propionate/3-hydroxycinnamic acid hydroxylase [Paraburkholderia sp. UCT2]|nr:bifunctional 3-(3-hydroxy-phenyl)propionate/3-hydroxycinnamic acid hydroxylase [Paraburkholderia sp. UCT2]